MFKRSLKSLGQQKDSSAIRMALAGVVPGAAPPSERESVQVPKFIDHAMSKTENLELSKIGDANDFRGSEDSHAGDHDVEEATKPRETTNNPWGLDETVNPFGVAKKYLYAACAVCTCLLLIIIIIIIVVTTAGGDGGESTDYTTVRVVTCTTYPCTVDPGLLKLPSSPSDSVLVLSGSQSHDTRRSAAATAYPVARSYNGRGWELIQESRHELSTDGAQLKLLEVPTASQHPTAEISAYMTMTLP